MSDRSAAHLNQIPDDLQLITITSCAAAWGTTERKARAVLVEHNIPIVQLGARSSGVRLTHAREVMTKRERASAGKG